MRHPGRSADSPSPPALAEWEEDPPPAHVGGVDEGCVKVAGVVPAAAAAVLIRLPVRAACGSGPLECAHAILGDLHPPSGEVGLGPEPPQQQARLHGAQDSLLGRPGLLVGPGVGVPPVAHRHGEVSHGDVEVPPRVEPERYPNGTDQEPPVVPGGEGVPGGDGGSGEQAAPKEGCASRKKPPRPGRRHGIAAAGGEGGCRRGSSSGMSGGNPVRQGMTIRFNL